MSSIAKEVKKTTAAKKDKAVENYMGGISFEMDPITTLRMVAASSIFAEPQYYRDSPKNSKYASRLVPDFLKEFLVIDSAGKKTDEYMEEIIDKALDYDFGAVLDIAAELRNDYYMRLNPQVIMVRAAMHPNRVKFTEKEPTKFREVQTKVMLRADEPATQFAYYLYAYKDKKGLPSILKRTWAGKLSGLNRYQVAKYKNAEVGMIDTVRVCHAKSEILNELMKTGTVVAEEGEKTWENLKSEGKSWKEILSDDKFRLPHMALLRNLRGIATELNETADRELMKGLLKTLVRGVEKGRQFPFRYYTAYQQIDAVKNLPFKVMIMEALEECLQLSLNNLPKLEGKTMVLSDNSGSAWGTIPSEYGTVKVAEIGNLSAVLTAMRSDEGYVGVFGDRLTVIPIKKNASILDNLKEVNKKGQNVGGGTENGIWLFFEEAISEGVHWDNIFIYSDMQAGRGELYCTYSGEEAYKKFQNEYPGTKSKLSRRTNYVDVMTLLTYYRAHVNPKVNMFSVQTAGYDNSVLPQYCYRANLLTGWTGKEVVFADAMIKQWNEIENSKSTQ